MWKEADVAGFKIISLLLLGMIEEIRTCQQASSRDLKYGPLEHKTGMLPTLPGHFLSSPYREMLKSCTSQKPHLFT